MISLRTICAALTGAFLLGFGTLLLNPSSYIPDVVQDAPPHPTIFNSQSYVQGPPTQSFRGQYPVKTSKACVSRVILVSDNLRNDTKYITTWGSAGWSTLAPINHYVLESLITAIY